MNMSIRRGHTTLCAVGVSACVMGIFGWESAAQSSVTERMVKEELSIQVPPDGCDVPRMAGLIAKAIHVPAGIEYAASCANERPYDTREPLALSGMTAERALQRLRAVDPRYEWTVVDGVLVFRPLSTWMDGSHFLGQRLPAFSVKDQDLNGVLGALQAAIGAPRFGAAPPPHTDGNRRLSVALDATTVMGALNAVVRAHGAARWEITYCQPEPDYQNATFWLKPFEGAEVKNHGVFMRDARGEAYDPCAKVPSP